MYSFLFFQEPIRPLEKRALNFLVNEFLLKNSYKLTSITFSDENHDQVKFSCGFFCMPACHILISDFIVNSGELK